MLVQEHEERSRAVLPELEDGFVKGRISVVLPAYNEANNIAASIADTIEQIDCLSNDWEIIVVDDGSTDETRAIAKTFRHSRVKVVSHDVNKGKGHALKQGFRHVTGEFTFFVDSDMEVRTAKLRAYLAGLKDADIVIGSKRHPESRVRAPLIRRIFSISFNVLERLLTGVKVTDTQTGLKSSRSAALYRILPLLSVKRYAFDAELLAVASLFKFRIREMPVYIDLDSRFRMGEVFRMFVDLLGIAYRLRILRWYQSNQAEIADSYRPLLPW